MKLIPRKRDYTETHKKIYKTKCSLPHGQYFKYACYKCYANRERRMAGFKKQMILMQLWTDKCEQPPLPPAPPAAFVEHPGVGVIDRGDPE